MMLNVDANAVRENRPRGFAAPEPGAAAPSTTYPATQAPEPNCHPAYTPCLPNLPGDALNCGDLTPDQKPVTVNEIGVDPYLFLGAAGSKQSVDGATGVPQRVRASLLWVTPHEVDGGGWW